MCIEVGFNVRLGSCCGISKSPGWNWRTARSMRKAEEHNPDNQLLTISREVSQVQPGGGYFSHVEGFI